LAIVTGASSGIGLHLAIEAAKNGFDLLVAADEPDIYAAAEQFKTYGTNVDAIEVDLATLEGVDALYDKMVTLERPADALLANAGRGLGDSFLNQAVDDWKRVLDSNVTGTLYLIHRIARDFQARGQGRILITGSIAGFMPGTFQAVYNGSKAFLNSFSYALANELKESGVTVTCLMPGATETKFFERADMLDTKIGQSEKDDPADVAQVGFKAMMNGEASVISGWKNKAQVAMANVTPAPTLAEAHRKQAQPGSN
jgi:short-subunit dehydrogenase